MKTSVYKTSDTEYTLVCEIDCWCYSIEKNVKIGDIRYIGNELLKATEIVKNGIFSYRVNWTSITPAENTAQIKTWWDRLA